MNYFDSVYEHMNILMDKVGYFPDERPALADAIQQSMDAKEWILRLFEKSPYYNGKGQIICPITIEGEVDTYNAHVVCDWLKDEAKIRMLEKADCGAHEYNELSVYIRRLNNILLDMDIHDTCKGRTYAELREDLTRFYGLREKLERQYTIKFGIAYTKESVRSTEKVVTFCNFIMQKSYLSNDITESDADYLNDHEVFQHPVRAGMKYTRVIRKLVKETGLLDKLDADEWNHYISLFGDAMVPVHYTKWSVLSINFCDFFTMSWGTNWTACTNTDKYCNVIGGGYYSNGFNSRRCIDYAMDPSTMVFYTVDSAYDGNDWEMQLKSTRQLFHFNGNTLIQSRLYPQSTCSRRKIYDQYRHGVEKILADCLGVNNLWKSPKRGTISRYDEDIVYIEDDMDYSYIDFLEEACHGGDESDFQSEVNYTRLSCIDEDDYTPVMVGVANSPCIVCGKESESDYANAACCCECYTSRR